MPTMQEMLYSKVRLIMKKYQVSPSLLKVVARNLIPDTYCYCLAVTIHSQTHFIPEGYYNS